MVKVKPNTNSAYKKKGGNLQNPWFFIWRKGDRGGLKIQKGAILTNFEKDRRFSSQEISCIIKCMVIRRIFSPASQWRNESPDIFFPLFSLNLKNG